MLRLLNIVFHLIHLTIIFIFLFGLFFEKFRPLHFILSISILISWAGLGIIFGFGYCLLTDLHWKVKKKLNQNPGTELYIKYVIDKLTGRDISQDLINILTNCIFFCIFIISAIVFIMVKN